MKRILPIILVVGLGGTVILSQVNIKKPVPDDKVELPSQDSKETPSPVENKPFEQETKNRPSPTKKYFLHQDIIATVFWVGEEETIDNNYISNQESIWDLHWLENYGGVDDPENREGWFPQGFTPLQNPFYVALPYSDFINGVRQENVTLIPWYEPPASEKESLVKNRWVKIYHQEKVCFAQWEDTGPFLLDDFDYVFGTANPKNTFGQKAGIDISPAVRDCLKVGSVSQIDWQFIDEADIPAGPWKEIITRNGIDWEK